jgi:hypothetical protein
LGIFVILLILAVWLMLLIDWFPIVGIEASGQRPCEVSVQFCEARSRIHTFDHVVLDHVASNFGPESTLYYRVMARLPGLTVPMHGCLRSTITLSAPSAPCLTAGAFFTRQHSSHHPLY